MELVSGKVAVFVREMLSEEKESTNKSVVVKVRNRLSFSIRKDQLTSKNRKMFERAFRKFEGIEIGLSHLHLVEKPELFMTKPEALAMMAIGKALGVWDIFPTYRVDEEVRDRLFELDPYGVLPFTVGFNKDGVLKGRKNG